MAYIGFRHPVVAVGTYTDGSEPSYASGCVLGKGMSGSISWNKSEEHMYADDAEVETDLTITGGSVTCEVDDLAKEVYCKIFGLTAGSDGLIVDTDAPAPYCGFGYIRVKRKGNTRKFEGYWIYKVQFGHGNEDMTTKQDRVTFASSSVEATILGVNRDSSGSISFRERKEFDNESACLTWLNGKAGIT